MKTKHSPGRIRIQKNTDTVDIEHKCLGLDIWIEGDSLNMLNSNRGLHTQIRHNGKKEVFDEACRVAQLIAAAPEMLEALNMLACEIEYRDKHNKPSNNYPHVAELYAKAIRKAKGEEL